MVENGRSHHQDTPTNRPSSQQRTMLPRNVKKSLNYAEKKKREDPVASDSQTQQKQISYLQPVQTRIPVKGGISKESSSQPQQQPERTSPIKETQIKLPVKVTSPPKKISVINESNMIVILNPLQ